MTSVLIATAKDEGHNILEWVAHHRLAGFDDFILFQNDSSDGTEQTLEILQDLGLVRYFDNPAPPGRHQMKAYRRASRMRAFQTADFAMVLDLDEFVNIRVGDKTLTSLYAALPDFDHLALNWRLFGSGQIPVISDDLVTARFSDTTSPERYTRWFTGYKSLFRPSVFAIPGIHRPKEPRKSEGEIVCVNGSGLVAPEFAQINWRSKDPLMARFACVHHYAVKDVETFILKSVRGSAHQIHRSLQEKYWRKRNFGGTRDFSLVERAPLVWNEMLKLDRLSGGRLMTLRSEAFAYHRGKLQALRHDERYNDLRQFCLKSLPRNE